MRKTYTGRPVAPGAYIKLELRKEFNHSFDKLNAIVCWTSRVKDGEEMIDLGGNRGVYQVSTRADGTRTRFVVLSSAARNVEVILFFELLKVRGYEFKAPGE